MERINLFIKITQWLKKSLVIVYLTYSIAFIIVLQLAKEFFKGIPASNIDWALFVFGIFIMAIGSLLQIPLYKIFHNLGELLKKIHDNSKSEKVKPILPSREFKQLRKYLLIQTLINLIFDTLTFDNLKPVSTDAMKFYDYLMNKESSEMAANLFNGAYLLYSWIFPYFGHSMPLYFLAFVYAISFIYDENLNLKLELNEVI